MTLNPFLLVIVPLVGGIGAVLRYLLGRLQGWLPWGILIANVLASAVAAVIVIHDSGAGFFEVSMVAGFAGGLSTLSSVVGQSYGMLVSKQWLKSIAYPAASFLLPVLAVWIVSAL